MPRTNRADRSLSILLVLGIALVGEIFWMNTVGPMTVLSAGVFGLAFIGASLVAVWLTKPRRREGK